jgi:hypothetical protein
VPAELRVAAEQVGGILGAADLTGCLAYRDITAFTADQARHLNQPSWFQGPVLYGFVFSSATPLPFRSYPGWMRFFAVEEEAQP